MFDKKANKSKSGIYKIVSYRFPDRIYIGSAVNLTAREKRHFRSLAAGNHFNSKLQNHYDKYGAADLFFVILEFCPAPELLLREQFYIDLRAPHFNINPVAGSRLGSKHSISSRLKISRSWKKRAPISVSTRYARYLK